MHPTRLLITILFILFVLPSCNDKQPTKPEDKPQLVYDTTSHNITWIADTIGQFGDELNDIWAADSANFYAVGSINISSDPNRIPRSIIKWNGTAWVDLPNVGYGQSQQLSNSGKAIFGFSNSDIWIAGVSRANGTVSLQGEGYPFSHFNGSNWTTVTAPTPTWDIFGIRVSIYDMWGSDKNHLWAVGDSGLVYFWNGGIWTKQSVPNEVVSKGITLESVFGISQSEVYACGYNANSETALLRFDGTQWAIVYLSPYQSIGQPYYIGNTHYGEWQLGNDIKKYFWLFADKLYVWDRVAFPNQMQFTSVQGFDLQGFGDGVSSTKGSNMFVTNRKKMAHWNGVSWKIFENIAPQIPENIIFNEVATKAKITVGVGFSFESFSRPYYFIGRQE